MFSAPSYAMAQYPRVDIPASEVRAIRSSIVKGQEYELQIMLPGGYERSDKRYPVVYLMDSQWDFPLVASIYGQQYFDGFIPEMIVVGVTWSGSNANPDSLRARDYTPSKENRLPQSGGADAFLSFMKNELFPFVEKNYRADSSNRILMGCSLGGLFTLYALFTHPELFKGYIAASPAIQWNKSVLNKYGQNFLEKKLLNPVRIFMTVGDVETGRKAFEKFSSEFKPADKNIEISSKVLENTGHSGTKTETYSRGLQLVFERPDISVDEKILDMLVGTYKTENGDIINVEKEGTGLRLRTANGSVQQLHAASETEFYAKSHFLKIRFFKQGDQINTLELSNYGSTQLLEKMKASK
jgi:predicted alpha/beta superfamily hydrolase